MRWFRAGEPASIRVDAAAFPETSGIQRQDVVAAVIVAIALIGVDLLTPLGWIGHQYRINGDPGPAADVVTDPR